MRQHVVPEDVGTEDGAEARLVDLFLIFQQTCRLPLGHDAHGPDLERRPRHRVEQVRRALPDGARPVNPRPPAHAGVEHDRIELGERLQQPAREGAYGDEVRQVDVLRDEGDAGCGCF